MNVLQQRVINLKELSIFSAILWTILIVLSASWNLNLISTQAIDLATKEARANWSKDQAFRRWASLHGGLYVEPDERTQPNPFLAHLKNRDVVTTEGMKLTLMNPAYMMNQMAKEFEETYGVKGHITAQVLLNPANKPDPWELSALKRFDRGVKEVSELSTINGEPYLRLIKPMIMKQGCVACHGHLGFKVGDIRGGVSISIPLLPYQQAAASSRYFLITSHVGVWLLGILGIVFFAYRSHQRAAQQQLTDAALSKSAKEWDYAMDFFEDAVILTELDGKISRVNQSFYNLTGRSAEQTINQNINAIMHPMDEDNNCLLCIARKERRDEVITLEAEHPDNSMGKPLEITQRVIREDNDKPIGVLLGIHDLSRSRQASAAIKEREQQISDLLNSTAEGIFSLDTQGICTLANPACVEMLGFNNAEEIVNRDMHTLMHHSHANGSEYLKNESLIYNSLKTNSEVHCSDEVFWRKDGSSFPVEYWAHPIIRNDKVSGSVITFIDITERLNTEQILRRSQKMDALGQLTSGIAHDFNNQLGIVNGYLEILEEEYANNETSSKWISVSQKATRRCIHLTQQLLNFSRLQQTNIEIINLDKKLNNLRDLIQRTVTPAVKLVFDIEDNLWKVKTSRGDLDDALLNLIINARDAMPDGGILTFQLSNHTEVDNVANQQDIKPGEYVLIKISDTGCGMSEDIQEHIFDPFFSTKEVGKGTGLGMSMVYGFVNRSQGHISLQSEPGVGTQFSIYLPRCKDDKLDQPVDLKTVTAITSEKQDRTVLVVDDEEHLRELAQDILSAQGYQTLAAANGKEALEILRGEQHIDILFCDIVMPGGISGYQVANEAKKLRPEISIQLTSGLADTSLLETGEETSNSNILQKPYNRASLITCINKICR
ncbi:MAG TPA: DUF3365 domain-containing protein [Gammaproteobacteria bacterium]|nr:DUF3365 domain-containing protein [Gammaproteobacteria bacterium]